MIKRSFVYIIIISCLLMLLISCPLGGGGGLIPGMIVVPGMIDVAGVSANTYTQTDGPNSFIHNISGFEIAETEVAYSLWHDIRTWAVSHDYFFQNDGREGDDGTIGAVPTTGNTEPVTTISWRDAIVWCNAYSEREGLTPVYFVEAGFATVIRDSRDANGAVCDAAFPDWSANGLRLPTEGEWQFAASDGGFIPHDYAAGATTDYTDFDADIQVAWFGNSTTIGIGNTVSTQSVGTTLEGTALGLMDMSGNVAEWCWDWFGIYPGATQNDYHGAGSGIYRVFRGGSWFESAEKLQIGDRSNHFPSTVLNYVGFRVARNH